jgi:ligand-binding sensor domain-containing protein
MFVRALSMKPEIIPITEMDYFRWKTTVGPILINTIFLFLDSCMDIITVAANNSGTELFYGSFGGGLIEMTQGQPNKIYKQNTGLKAAVGDPNSYRISGLALDQEQQLWISNYGSPTPLVVKKPNNTWVSIPIPFYVTENALSQIVIDDVNQKWIVAPKGNGLICYQHGNSIDNLGDDHWKYFRSGIGNGNLPDNEVYCLAKDKDGIIWVGTGKGMAIFPCASEVFSTGCEAYLPIVQNGNFNGYLLSNETITAIAVDGANRKWVGTKNGVWLLSATGEKIIYHFTENNSPLLNNHVNQLTIDPKTGEVFIATETGLCSYRSTATADHEGNEETMLIFPNPVPPNYNGTIAVNGLSNNALVQITELNGRLVYQTRSLGGQAVWDGKNYKGIKVSSGVYLVLVTDEKGKAKKIGKLFFIK